MADKKISALTAATTPLAGTEVFPIVQSSTTVKATIADVQATPVTSGTANAVQYLNGSKVPTTGTAFTFDGTNLALGTTLKTWYSSFGTKAFQFAASGALFGLDVSNTDRRVILSNNSYDDAAGNQIYTNTGAATRYQMVNGAHQWYAASSGSGGATVNFGNAKMELLNDNLSLLNGNFVPSTAAKGINFTANTPAAGMTSQLLNWYEEGTFTPVIADAASGGNAATISAAGRYTRIGRQVTITFTADSIDTTGLTAGNSVYFRNFPFTSNASGYNTGSFYSYRVGGGAGQSASVVLPPSSTAARIFIYTGVSLTADTPLKVSDLVSGTSSIYFTLTYFV